MYIIGFFLSFSISCLIFYNLFLILQFGLFVNSFSLSLLLQSIIPIIIGYSVPFNKKDDLLFWIKILIILILISICFKTFPFVLLMGIGLFTGFFMRHNTEFEKEWREGWEDFRKK